MPADPLWIIRYETAWRPYDTAGSDLSHTEQDTLRAVGTYRPGKGQPAQPLWEAVSEITGHARYPTIAALRNLRKLGLIPDAEL
ncbi:hypothetical protein [Acidisphaera sp. L21]|uniref:hypothetical protein n=1 Tax=Acidisphaera sp. L21 TaxID=1641851 RepID=UPI00131E4903|nr:hypothetical protein [Acidisphaera sp. L21]